MGFNSGFKGLMCVKRRRKRRNKKIKHDFGTYVLKLCKKRFSKWKIYTKINDTAMLIICSLLSLLPSLYRRKLKKKKIWQYSIVPKFLILLSTFYDDDLKIFKVSFYSRIS
jgi:hypothetical protein